MKKNGPASTRVHCDHCPLRPLECFAPFSDEEAAFMPSFKSGEMEVDRGTALLLEGSASAHLFTVLEGYAIRFVSLPEGRRQVVGFVFPGDFVGLQSAMLEEMHHSVEAATRMRLCVFNRRDFNRLYRSCPDRGFDVTWLAAREERFLGDQLATVGQRGATERVAFGLHRLHRRALAVGLATRNRMDMPFTQQNLADALGLSLVHTNKTLRRLRDRGVVEWSNRTLKILDGEKLQELAGDDGTELRPRPLI